MDNNDKGDPKGEPEKKVIPTAVVPPASTPKVVDTKPDPQIAVLLAKVDALHLKIEGYESASTQKQFAESRNEALAKLVAVDPEMGKLLAAESNIDRINMAIEVSTLHKKSIDTRFPEFQQIKKQKDAEVKQISGIDPFTGELA